MTGKAGQCWNNAPASVTALPMKIPISGELKSRAIKEAREQLLLLPGVGRKIADCVLLFGYGFPEAFPVDVWVMRALRQLYFPRKRKMTSRQLLDFSEDHFGPNGGYAQQYLFHYMRTQQPSRGSAKVSQPTT